jgi:hypothetical protein
MLNTRSFPGISKSDASKKGREMLEAHIAKGRKSAIGVVEHVQNAIPEDSIVWGRTLEFAADGKGVVMSAGNSPRRVHRHALTQIAGKAGVPSAFLSDLSQAPEIWKHDLAAEILNKHFHCEQEVRNEDASRKRYLVRSINGEARGFLSDRYRRIDSRPTLDAFVEECQQVGAVPVEGIVTDTRVSLRAILPVVFEPVEGEIMAFGAEWGNSDFGAAKHWFRTFILRLWCLNGATMEDVLSQVHTGAKLSDDFAFSRQTYELDTRAQVSALRDVIKGALGPARIDANLNLIKEASEKEVAWKNVSGSLVARLSKGEQKLVKDAYESADVINLPAGKSVWRMSNALSWIANGSEVDAERKLDLQRMAGEVLDGRKDRIVRDDA